MKSLVLSAITCLLTASAVAQTLPSKGKLIEAIETFCKAPLSAEGTAAGKTIASLWHNPDHKKLAQALQFPEFTVTQKQAPDVDKSVIDALFTAGLAGNMLPQLKDGNIVNHPYDGLRQTLKTYAQFRTDGKCPRIPKLDQLADLEAKGQLKQHVEQVIKDKNYPKTYPTK